MKKIYMILAAISLLTLSLNAQDSHQKKVTDGNKKVQICQSSAPTTKAGNFSFNKMLQGIKGMSSVLQAAQGPKGSSNSGASRAPLRLNAGEELVGPFTTYDTSVSGYTGLGFPDAYGGNYQQIYITTELDRNEFIDHNGDSIVGFRFALAGNTSQTAVLYDFIAWPFSDDYFSQVRYTWSIPQYTGATPVVGYDDIIIKPSNDYVNLMSIQVKSGNTVITSWSYANDGGYIPAGWDWEGTPALNNDYSLYFSDDGYFIIDGSMLAGMSNVTVVINTALYSNYTGNQSISVNGYSQPVSSTTYSDKTWDISPSGTTVPSYVELAAGQWYDCYLDEPIAFNVADSIIGMRMGYRYFQYPSSQTSELLYPIAVNPQSTGHNHVSYMYKSYTTTTTLTKTVADGTSTTSGYQYLPVYGYYFETVQKTQMIYSASMLGLQNGDQITSITFYPRDGITFYNGNVKLSLANTTTSSFTSANALNISTTQVAATGRITANSSQTEWIITFDQPFTYTGNNLLVQIDTEAGNYGNSQCRFYGAQQNNYTSFYSYSGGNTKGRSYFLPKATFGYLGTTTDYYNGWWTEDFSQYGDLAVQLIFKSKKPKPEAPTVTSNSPEGGNTTTITITPDPNTDGQLVYYVIDQNNQQTQNLTFTRGEQDYTVTVHAYTTEGDEYMASDETVQTVTIPALPQTEAPNITWERVGDNIVITATGNGTVTLNVPGYPQATGTGSASVTVPCGADTQSLTVTATAQETNHLVSPTTTETVEIPYLITATPTINATPGDDAYTITATGDGTVHMYVDGVEVTQPYEAPRQMNDYTITVTATAQESGKHISETATEVITIPGRMTTEGWLLMTGTYSGHQALSFIDSLTNKVIMIGDSISAMTYDNRHPDHYDYWFEEVGHDKTSNVASIPVQKTYTTMYGLYTKAEVDGDTHRTLTANKANVSMSFDIKVDREKHMYNYSLYRSEVSRPFTSIDALTQPISKLVYNPSTNTFSEAQSYDVLPTIDNVGDGIVKRVDRYFTDAVGQPLDYENYVPVIWTMGTLTGRTDGKNNSYGSDIKRNTLGDVDISIYVEKSNYTTTVNGQTVQPGVWQYQGQDYTVFTPVITITGTPPAKYVANDGDTIVYEPYMFRAWCLYEHPHDFVRNSSTQLLEDNGEIPVAELPLLLGTVVTDKDTCTIGGLWKYDMDRLPWAFGAPVSTPASALEFVVRFYYKAIVKDSGRPLFRSNRDGEEEYLIVETSDNPDQIPTGIEEIFNNGRVPVSTTYVNSLGMQSDVPFDGLNIVVTRYSDGTTSTVKVMR
jgi:hypothetical protein